MQPVQIPFSLPSLTVGLVLMLVCPAPAQTFTVLHSFTGIIGNANSDGQLPRGGVILTNDTLYGTTEIGGPSGSGTVFKVNTNGLSFSLIHKFSATQNCTNSDGSYQESGVILAGNTLYGMAYSAGTGGAGTIYKVGTDGVGFTVLHRFITASPCNPATGTNDGAGPFGSLRLSEATLYGMTSAGGLFGNGNVFSLTTNGTAFTVLHTFAGNPDGANPHGALLLSGGVIYGTCLAGGGSNMGTVFAMSTNATGFTNLHSFTGGADGANPWAELILSGSMLYGTASQGGNANNGTVFAVSVDGTFFKILHSFSALSAAPPYPQTNSDGANPYAGLLLSGNTLYGTCFAGGISGNGSLFAVNTDGSGFRTLHSFAGNDGSNPKVTLSISGNTLYGAANYGGSSGAGTVFALFLPIPPQLSMNRSGVTVILSWPTNAAGFLLQSTSNLFSPVVWNTNSQAPVMVNGQNTVTDLLSGPARFYRLNR